MKREVRGMLIGFLIAIIVMGVVAYANPASIEVLFNSINIVVDGNKVDVDNILYNGTTYAPMRAVAEMLGKEVGWDENTNTATIGGKAARNNVAIEDGEYVVTDDSGNALYSFKINAVTTMVDRNQFSDKNPAQVVLIDYTYKNIADPEEVYLSEMYFKLVDSGGKIGYTYPNSVTSYPQSIPIGVTCDAQMVFGLDNVSDVITINFYKDLFGSMTASLEVPVN